MMATRCQFRRKQLSTGRNRLLFPTKYRRTEPYSSTAVRKKPTVNPMSILSVIPHPTRQQSTRDRMTVTSRPTRKKREILP